MNNKLFSTSCFVSYCFILFVLNSCTQVSDIIGVKYINGESITSNYILSNHNANGVDYIVTGTIDVMTGGKLIIERGTAIQFMPTAGINVSGGRLEIRGDASSLVTLFPMSDTPLASWKGINIGTHYFNEIFYAHIKSAKTTVANSGIYIQKMSHAVIKNCIIEDTGCGIYEAFPATPTISNNTYISVGQGHCEEF